VLCKVSFDFQINGRFLSNEVTALELINVL